MAKENKIVDIINASVKAALADKRFSGSEYAGITQIIQNGDGGNMPCTVDNNGECTWIDVDDTKPVQVYHRMNGSSFSLDDKEQFGNNLIRNQVSSMSLFVVAQRNKIKLPVEDLLTLVTSGMPTGVPDRKSLNLNSCKITVQSADVNAQGILKREQPNKILDPQVIMFELKYQIECSYGKDCINTLCCT